MSDLKILVVDDESRMRKLVKDFLTKSGYQVLEAADGENGWMGSRQGNSKSIICADYYADCKRSGAG